MSSDLEWRKVNPFKKVDAARVRYLTIAEAKRLINAADPDFRRLVQAALQTGARYGELARLTVADFNPDVGTISIQQSKSGKSRHIVLTDEGAQFFRRLCAGGWRRNPVAQSEWAPWDFAHQIRPMTETVARAKIKPPISFHGLRHTWASHAIMSGMPLMVVVRKSRSRRYAYGRKALWGISPRATWRMQFEKVRPSSASNSTGRLRRLDNLQCLLPAPDLVEFGQRSFKFVIEEPHCI